MRGWLWFALVQLISLVATVVGWFLLVPFCLARAWEERAVMSINPAKNSISRWTWKPLNCVYGNPEDGVSGKALLNNGLPYMPNAWAPWRAYMWSAWRNSSNNLKYVFVWKGGPFYRWENAAKSFYFQAGFYPSGYPVISLGRM